MSSTFTLKPMKKDKHSSIVLVGCVDGDPLQQKYLGTILFQESKLFLTDSEVNEKSYSVEVKSCRKGSYSLNCFDRHVAIVLSTNEKKYIFSKSRFDTGDQGTILQGPELIEMLDKMFYSD